MKKIIKLEIINLPIEQLQINTDNPRKIKSERLQKLADSLNGTPELFNARPCLCSNRTGVNIILGGNMRYLAAKKLKWKTVPAIIIPNLTIEQEQEITIKDNGDFGEWDFEQLANAWDHLPLVDWGVNLPVDWIKKQSGYSEKDNAIPTEPETVVIKKGDLIELGAHRVLCGDSTINDNIEVLMGGKNYDCIVFDPPYELVDLYKVIPKFVENKKLVVFWDFKRFGVAPYSAIKKGWEPQYEFIWDNVTSWFTPNRPLQKHKACGVFCEDPFFDTDLAVIHDGKERKAKIVSNTRGKYDYKPLDGARHISTVEQFQNTTIEGGHAHAKPMDWVSAIYNGLRCESFLDLFGGSGSTLIYCEKNRKESFTIEIEENNCQIIIQRWCDFTCNNTIKINGEEIKWSDYK